METKLCPNCGKNMIRTRSDKMLATYPALYPLLWRCGCGYTEDANTVEQELSEEDRFRRQWEQANPDMQIAGTFEDLPAEERIPLLKQRIQANVRLTAQLLKRLYELEPRAWNIAYSYPNGMGVKAEIPPINDELLGNVRQLQQDINRN